MSAPLSPGGRDVALILSGTTCSVDEAAQVLGLSGWAIYKAIRAGEAPFPVIRCGRRLVVPVAPLRRVLGIDTDGAES